MGDSLKRVFIFSVVCLTAATSSAQKVFNVLNYGALGNGNTDDTNGFVKAWEETCASSASAVMQVPSDKTFLVRQLQFIGPCNSNNVTVEIDGNLVAPSDPSDWKCDDNTCHNWIYFHRVDGLTIHGQGTIDGRGEKWWLTDHNERPSAVEISNCNNVHLRGGLRFKDSPMMHVVLHQLTSVVVSNITIQAPGRSPNTDGIHVSASTDVQIDHSRIGTGDDCVAILGGSSSVRVTNIVCGPGHGISIGSLGRDGAEDRVEDIRVSDVVFKGTTNGVRIKTWQGGKGYARDIIFERILSHDTEHPIIIDQFYCDHRTCAKSESAVEITNVTFRQILGTSRSKSSAVSLLCSEAVPCRDILVEDLHILTMDGNGAGCECSNVYGRTQGDVVPKLSCLI